MGGELKAIIETIDFSSKNELLENLRKLRESTVKLAPQETQRSKRNHRRRYSTGLLYHRKRTFAL